ncbi:MAG TPA: hypothetical protein VJ850_00685 [Candidatus Limnocylindrales bacterium]|nr:hypothetical protein [Candidatus Limnocylindrales bacterium]
MSRFFDRGAIVAAYVGIGMAIMMAISFLLVVPIEIAYLILSVLGAIVIGYYANARAQRRRGEWRRILPNSLLAGVVMGLSLSLLLLGNKALFFFADSGYPDFNRVESGVSVGETCQTGADCVYHRYLAQPNGPQALASSGVTDAASFGDVYWRQQWTTAEGLVLAATIAALFGGLMFGLAGPRKQEPALRGAPAPA